MLKGTCYVMRSSVVAGRGGISYAAGEQLVFPPGVQVPACIALNADVYDGPAPHTARVFNEAEYERATAPPPEPQPMQLLNQDAVRRRFRWTAEQFTAARSSYGFPKALRTRSSLLHGPQSGFADVGVIEELWERERVDAWVHGLKQLHLE